MGINWEFLLGLLLPAYGIGFVWLIKTAREDPPLYALVEMHLKRILIAFQFAIVLVFAWARFFSDLAGQVVSDLGGMTVVALILTNTVQGSFAFFRRIAALPPKIHLTTESEAAPTRSPTELPE